MLTSTFRQVTNQLLLEYRTDQYKIQHSSGTSGTPGKFYIIQGNDNSQYLVDTALLPNMMYPYIDEEDYYFPGNKAISGLQFVSLPENEDDPVAGQELGYTDTAKNSFTSLGTVILADDYAQRLNGLSKDDTTPEAEEIRRGVREASLHYDSVRIYMSTGYNMNAISGIALRISAKCSKVMDMQTGEYKKVDKKFYFLDWFMPKEYLKNTYRQADNNGNFSGEAVVRMLPTPLYMNSKFYDRYIEVRFPAPMQFSFTRESFLNAVTDIEDPEHITDLELFREFQRMRQICYTYTEEDKDGNISYYRGDINAASGLTIEFSTVSPDYLEYTETTGRNPYEAVFSLDAPKEIIIKPDSSSKFFNAYLFEDPEENAITYMPVYGDPQQPQTLRGIDTDIMGCIETGVITLYDFADYDTMNNGMEDFIDMYGPEFYKWVIINELSVTYHYDYIIKPDNADARPQPLTEYFTNTIDYTGKTLQHGEFWKSRFIPYIKRRPNMECIAISVKYTTHLYNRMNNRDLTKTASITIKDPIRYQTRSIDTANINQYKIVNKIIQGGSPLSETMSGNQVNVEKEYVVQYCHANNLLVKDPNSDRVYEQGKFTLKLYRRSQQYKFRLYVLNDDNIRIPYDMSGFDSYMLEFPSVVSGSVEQIQPVYSSQSTNLKAGQLMFYISSEKAARIMQVPSSERRFSIVTYSGGQQTTLYEGYVDWLTK